MFSVKVEEVTFMLMEIGGDVDGEIGEVARGEKARESWETCWDCERRRILVGGYRVEGGGFVVMMIGWGRWRRGAGTKGASKKCRRLA